MTVRLEGTDLVIDGFDKGIAPDPFSGIADLRNMNISGTPNEASVSFKTLQVNFLAYTGTATLVDTGDFVQFASKTNDFGPGLAITVNSTVGGLTAGVVYYVLSGLGDGVNFQLALSYAGSAVAITSNTTTTATSINMGVPISRTTEQKVTAGIPGARYYILDNNGRAWVYDPGGILGVNTFWTYMNNTTLTNASGNGIVAWKGYLLVFRNALIDYVATSAAPTNGGANDWAYGWKTLSSNNTAYTGSHFAIVGQDDFVYWCDISVVGSLQQVAGQTFSPSNSATYTYGAIALQLPTLEVATTLGELGTNLLVGGVRNWIYPWDRTAVTAPAVGYRYPIMLPEMTTASIVTANNVAYIFCGSRGRIYATNGSNVQEVGKIPDYLTGTNKPYFYFKDAIWLRNKLFFSFAVTTNSAPSTALTTMGGVWSLDTNTKAIQCENILSYATYSGFASVLIALFIALPTATAVSGTPGEGYFAGWYNGTLSGVDGFSSNTQGTSLPYSTYEPYLDTEKIAVGQFLDKKTFSNLEFKLSEPLVSGEKIKILARVGLNNSQSPTDATAGYTLVGETTFVASTISDAYPVNFEKSQWVQFRVRTSSTSSSPSFVRLREIRLRQ